MEEGGGFGVALVDEEGGVEGVGGGYLHGHGALDEEGGALATQ